MQVEMSNEIKAVRNILLHGSRNLKSSKKGAKLCILQGPQYRFYMANLKSRNILQGNNMATYAAKHNIPFNNLDHLSEIIRISFDDSEIAKNFTCSPKKATSIVIHVLGQYSFGSSIALLGSSKFSLIVEESMDKGSKHLALVVHIFHHHKVTDLFGLLAIAIATTEELYNMIVNCFTKYNIIYKKI
nr:unnamed protein product [Callosobruchus analis]